MPSSARAKTGEETTRPPTARPDACSVQEGADARHSHAAARCGSTGVRDVTRARLAFLRSCPACATALAGSVAIRDRMPNRATWVPVDGVAEQSCHFRGELRTELSHAARETHPLSTAWPPSCDHKVSSTELVPGVVAGVLEANPPFANPAQDHTTAARRDRAGAARSDRHVQHRPYFVEGLRQRTMPSGKQKKQWLQQKRAAEREKAQHPGDDNRQLALDEEPARQQQAGAGPSRRGGMPREIFSN